jgi:NADH-ubiquinone oxidoreductase chain 6
MTLLLSLILPIILILAFAETPIVIGLTILMMALILAQTFAFSISSWYGFIIFLIYVGGILIIFSYFISLSSNNRTNLLPKNFLILLPSLVLFFIIFNTISINININYSFNIHSLYKTNYYPILLFLILILLFIMLVIIKIVSQSKGPIRPFF